MDDLGEIAAAVIVDCAGCHGITISRSGQSTFRRIRTLRIQVLLNRIKRRQFDTSVCVWVSLPLAFSDRFLQILLCDHRPSRFQLLDHALDLLARPVIRRVHHQIPHFVGQVVPGISALSRIPAHAIPALITV